MLSFVDWDTNGIRPSYGDSQIDEDDDEIASPHAVDSDPEYVESAEDREEDSDEGTWTGNGKGKRRLSKAGRVQLLKSKPRTSRNSPHPGSAPLQTEEAATPATCASQPTASPTNTQEEDHNPSSDDDVEGPVATHQVPSLIGTRFQTDDEATQSVAAHFHHTK